MIFLTSPVLSEKSADVRLKPYTFFFPRPLAEASGNWCDDYVHIRYSHFQITKKRIKLVLVRIQLPLPSGKGLVMMLINLALAEKRW